MTAGCHPLSDPCRADPCQAYRPGHHMHPIHARRLGETPWGWRDAVVTRIEGDVLHLAYLDVPATPLAWHHAPWTRVLRPGSPVRLHERYHALGCPAGWFNVVITGGIGPVPDPDDPDAWRDRMTAGVVDLRTGRALATDHAEQRDP